MTNYNFNGENYFYTIFETGAKGYILKEKLLNPSFEKTEQDDFFELAEIIGEKLSTNTEEELLNEIGYLCSYNIETHKAQIKTHTQGIGTVLASSKDKNRKNTMYLILTIDKITDFSNFPRHNPSREIIFFNNPEINEIDNIDEYYMN